MYVQYQNILFKCVNFSCVYFSILTHPQKQQQMISFSTRFPVWQPATKQRRPLHIPVGRTLSGVLVSSVQSSTQFCGATHFDSHPDPHIFHLPHVRNSILFLLISFLINVTHIGRIFQSGFIQTKVAPCYFFPSLFRRNRI